MLVEETFDSSCFGTSIEEQARLLESFSKTANCFRTSIKEQARLLESFSAAQSKKRGVYCGFEVEEDVDLDELYNVLFY